MSLLGHRAAPERADIFQGQGDIFQGQADILRDRLTFCRVSMTFFGNGPGSLRSRTDIDTVAQGRVDIR